MDAIISATDSALRAVSVPRFFRTERGFQGRFYCALQKELEERGLLQNGRILEMEYQKSARHNMHQRPDIILHIPAEENGRTVYENNLAVWALTRAATKADAQSDFKKLDEMIEILRYRLAIFVNLGSEETFEGAYHGRFPEQIRTTAVSMAAGQVVTRWQQGVGRASVDKDA